jgi:hypothetical protein
VASGFHLPFFVTTILLPHPASHILHCTVSEIGNVTIIIINKGDVFTISKIST